MKTRWFVITVINSLICPTKCWQIRYLRRINSTFKTVSVVTYQDSCSRIFRQQTIDEGIILKLFKDDLFKATKLTSLTEGLPRMYLRKWWKNTQNRFYPVNIIWIDFDRRVLDNATKIKHRVLVLRPAYMNGHLGYIRMPVLMIWSQS